MAVFKNLTTGIEEIVENAETIELMTASDNYEEVEEVKKVDKKADKKAEKKEK